MHSILFLIRQAIRINLLQSTIYFFCNSSNVVWTFLEILENWFEMLPTMQLLLFDCKERKKEKKDSKLYKWKTTAITDDMLLVLLNVKYRCYSIWIIISKSIEFVSVSSFPTTSNKTNDRMWLSVYLSFFIYRFICLCTLYHSTLHKHSYKTRFILLAFNSCITVALALL